MIPKVIHYCWFGKKRKPKLVRDCINSWKKHLPEYQIIEWNEDNSDLSMPFVVNAYNQKKWAFVSDYVRIKVLFDNGGIYLDTDMVLVKNLDSFLHHPLFFGAEDTDFISCGIIGATKNNGFIKNVLEHYEHLNFNNHSIFNITIPKIITEIFKDNFPGTLDFNQIVQLNQICIYPSEYFYPLHFSEKDKINQYQKYLKANTFAVHLWSSSWIEYSEFHYFRGKQYYKGFRKMLIEMSKKSNINLRYWRKILSSIKESFKIKKQ